MAGGSIEEAPIEGQSVGDALRIRLRQRVQDRELGALPVILALIAICVYFSTQSDAFLTSRNISNLFLQVAVTGTLAIGVVLVLLVGEIDLSIGSLMGASGAVLAVLMTSHDWPWWAAILAMLAFGTVVGLLQGIWVALLGVPSFVVTLAGLLIWLGVMLRIFDGQTSLDVSDDTIAKLANSYASTTQGWALAVGGCALYAFVRLRGLRQRRAAGLPVPPTLAELAHLLTVAVPVLFITAVLNQYRGIPVAALILLGLVIVFAWITTRTRFGRQIYAIGGNAESARRAGIPVTRVRIAVLSLSGTMAAAAALISVSRLASSGTLTGGGTQLLEAIGAAVIGGASLFGGRGTVWAALLGALVMGSVSNGLDLIGQPQEVKYVTQGVILLIAVTIDSFARRRLTVGGR